MIDSRDKKTLDAFSLKKRGRPSSGNALSAAERMAAKRERDRLAINQASFPADYAQLSTMALLEGLAEAVRDKCQPAAKKISAELIKRAKI